MPGWRFWQNCHFCHICQIRQYRQLLWVPSLLCALPCWRFWQNCHFRLICQLLPVSPTFMGSLIALYFALLANVAKLSFSPYLPNSPVSPTFMGPPHCFVLCHVGDCGKIVIFAIFAKFAIMFSFLPFLLLRAFLDIFGVEPIMFNIFCRTKQTMHAYALVSVSFRLNIICKLCALLNSGVLLFETHHSEDSFEYQEFIGGCLLAFNPHVHCTYRPLK